VTVHSARLTEFRGDSPAIRSVIDRLPVVAGARRTTLVTGATGTGKEMVARALHELASTRDAPYVAVNCGALPETLAEAELFGHTRGAFTGAQQARSGLIRSASGGTLFLDEVDSLTPALQAKLLRFLETGEFRAIGSDRAERSDAWVIAATNRDLDNGARRGEFRSDLLFRLDVMRIELPSLRERGTDIELLATHFLEAICGPAKAFTACARRAMAVHDWPGNVRELKHRVERAALLSEHGEIDAAALGLAAPVAAPPTPTVEAPGLGRLLLELVEREGMTLSEAVAFCEQTLIAAALRAEDNNKTRAAGKLGINVRTIFKKLRHD
jgi:DNA-binding NtrC family response regulator